MNKFLNSHCKHPQISCRDACPGDDAADHLSPGSVSLETIDSLFAKMARELDKKDERSRVKPETTPVPRRRIFDVSLQFAANINSKPTAARSGLRFLSDRLRIAIP